MNTGVFKSLEFRAGLVSALILVFVLAVWHALSTVWNRNGLGLDTQAVLPYDDRLALLPSYLQQLVMESLGALTQAAY